MKRKTLFSLLVIVAMLIPFVQAAPEVQAAPVVQAAPTGYGMIDVWVFVDNDENGIYSAGDFGLTDALACIDSSKRFHSCVGTDQGDTWWEDLRSGQYRSQVDRTTTPPGQQLRSIRCEETGSRAEYKGCHYNLADWSARVKLGKTTRINIFFALAP